MQSAFHIHCTWIVSKDSKIKSAILLLIGKSAGVADTKLRCVTIRNIALQNILAALCGYDGKLISPVACNQRSQGEHFVPNRLNAI